MVGGRAQLSRWRRPDATEAIRLCAPPPVSALPELRSGSSMSSAPSQPQMMTATTPGAAGVLPHQIR